MKQRCTITIITVLFSMAVAACSFDDLPDGIKERVASALVKEDWLTNYERKIPCELPNDHDPEILGSESEQQVCRRVIHQLAGSWRQLEFGEVSLSDRGTFICKTANINFEANRDRLSIGCTEDDARYEAVYLPFKQLQFRGYWKLGDTCLFHAVDGDESILMGFITKPKKSDIDPHLIGCYLYRHDQSGGDGGIDISYRSDDILLY